MGSDGGGNSAEAGSEQAELKRKLAWRMGFAGMMIVILLGTLAIFDRISAPEEPEPATVSSAPPAPAPKKDVTQPVKIAELPLEIGKEPPPVAAEPEGSASPIGKSSPFVEPPTRTPVLAAPVSPKMHADSGARPAVKPESKPDIKQPMPPHVQLPGELRSEPPSKVPSPPPERPTGKPPSVPPSSPTAPTAVPTAAPIAAPTVPPTAPTQKLPPPAAAQTPSAPTEDYLAVARPPSQPPQPPRLFSGFSLQAGIFSDLRLAEELHAKLALNGIPSSFEARVNVGPFKKREEAIAAREKMKALGIDSVLVLPKGGKR